MADRFFAGLEAFASFLEKTTVAFELPFVAAAEAASHVITENVKAVHGDASKLAALAQSTQDERVRLGFSPADPLLRDGSLLRDHVARVHEGMKGGAASNEPVALYSETGFLDSRSGTFVPPRPAFESGLHESEPALHALVDAATQVALGENPMILEAVAAAVKP